MKSTRIAFLIILTIIIIYVIFKGIINGGLGKTESFLLTFVLLVIFIDSLLSRRKKE
ncbi:hypothetical protein [Tenacibaculum insulae]|uniref:hypothetical protein n=1 Tax=Tenacibaculum insulae TaxID=2029677 RepID=UPI003AB421DB